MTLESPLNPFKKVVRGKERPYTSLDCINIEKQLGFTYGPGSAGRGDAQAGSGSGRPEQGRAVSGINRAPIRGSFLVSVFGNVGGQRVHLGTEAVLSRWNVQYCANCQTHLEVKAFVGVHASDDALRAAAPNDALLDTASYEVEIHTRDGVLTESQPQARPQGLAATAASPAAAPARRLFRIEVR